MRTNSHYQTLAMSNGYMHFWQGKWNLLKLFMVVCRRMFYKKRKVTMQVGNNAVP